MGQHMRRQWRDLPTNRAIDDMVKRKGGKVRGASEDRERGSVLDFSLLDSV